MLHLLTANNQSFSGSLDTIKRLRVAHEELPFDRGNALIMPIISRFERRVEYKSAEQWLDTFAKELTPCYNEWIHRDITVKDILNFTRIPYIPIWSFGEELPVIDKGTDDPEDIGYPLETLAALVAQRFSFTDVLIQNRDSFVAAAKNGAKEQESDVPPSASSPTRTTPNALIQIYISYSPEDEQLKKTLDKHLSTLRRQGVINTWSDREIPAGVERGSEINARLEAANVILLLISPDYLASPASDREMERPLKRAKAGEARIIPIILRPVDWQASPIRALQVLPSNGRPVTTWSSEDAAWADVAKGIREDRSGLINRAPTPLLHKWCRGAIYKPACERHPYTIIGPGFCVQHNDAHPNSQVLHPGIARTQCIHLRFYVFAANTIV